MAASFAFEGFVLDPGNRRLKRGGDPIELTGRYLDALALLVREQGSLVTKNRFLDEVWSGVPVTDEALTQCIKILRRQLGDNAASPKFIETVPKHGYRFIAAVEVREAAAPNVARTANRWRQFLATGVAGTIGGGIAGAIGGLVYGFAGASQPALGGMGAVSVLLVLLTVTTLVALIGGAGVSFGIAAAAFAPSRPWLWSVLGGAAGGLAVGAFGKLLGHDAFILLVGHSPGAITGAAEGALLGGAVGLGAWLSSRAASIERGLAVAGTAGAVAGLLIGLLSGRLMLGSLELLARDFPGSRLRLDHISRLLGERDFGPVTQVVTSCLEGALFAACIAAAMRAAGTAAKR
jgi:DNA-binding winged helix-turn-helix (wHTH) protein